MLGASRRGRGARRTVRGTTIGSLLGALAVLAGLAVLPTSAGAASDTTAVTFPGTPLTVYIAPRGQCQSSYIVDGVKAGNYFPGDSVVGDCGFFLAFPTEVSGKKNLVQLRGQTFGFNGNAGPSMAEEEDVYIPEAQSPVTGAGTEASPYAQTTTFRAQREGVIAAKITELTTYVNGAPQFTSTYTVKNESGSTEYFRAMYAGDLFVNGNDHGVGVFSGGPPRFVGGQNTGSGVIGGFIEVTPWSAWQEAYWATAPEGTEGFSTGDNGIWHDVEERDQETTAFNGTIEPIELDNGAGVEWDGFRGGTGLESGQETSFTVINRTQVPNGLQISPANQTLTQGQTETLSVTATDTAKVPYAGKTVRYTVTGANPQSGAVITNGAGQAAISYVGNNPGADTIQLFLDLNGNSTRDSGEPTANATVNWLPKPPVPNSAYTIKSIKANSNGTVTITFVPAQPGQATLEVTVPTASVSSAQAAKAKKCKKGQVKIHGKCRPINTISGKVKANALGGVPLTLTVKPSSKLKAALKKGRTVHLTAKLTYKSALGGAATVHTYHLTIKPKHKHH
jgi:hypothetical protein